MEKVIPHKRSGSKGDCCLSQFDEIRNRQTSEPDSSNSLFALRVKFFGVCRFISTYKSPVFLLCMLGIPAFFILNISPFWVPSGILSISCFPESVSTFILVPRVASTKFIFSIVKRSLSRLLKRGCFFICITMYKSPMPPVDASPSPASLSWDPSSTPGGIFSSILRVFWTSPLPLHSGHGVSIIVPCPWQRLQIVTCVNIPNAVRLVCLS